MKHVLKAELNLKNPLIDFICKKINGGRIIIQVVITDPGEAKECSINLN